MPMRKFNADDLGCLQLEVKQAAGLSADETELLFGLRNAHSANFQSGSIVGPIPVTERIRINLTLQLLETIAEAFGGWQHVGPWLRTDSVEPGSTIAWCTGGLEQLRALLVVAQDELG